MRRRVGKAAPFAVVAPDFDGAERHRGTQPHITLPVPQLYHPPYLSTEHTLVPSTLCGRSLEVHKHPRVPECVGFDPLQVEKFGDSFIIGTEEFLVDPIGDGCALDRDKAVFSEKSGLECQAEHATHTQFPRRVEESGHEPAPDTETTHGGIHRHRAYLRKILPENVESPTADHTVVAPGS